MKEIKAFRNYSTFFGDEKTEETDYLYQETTYDDNGNITAEVTYDKDGNISNRTISEYDDKNRLVREEKSDDDATEIKEFTYKEDILVSESYEMKDVFKEINLYEYDDNGTVTTKTSLDEDEEVTGHKFYKYDNDLLITVINEEDGEENVEYEYKYDENRDRIKTIYHNMENKKLVTDYTYYNHLLIKTKSMNEFGGIEFIEENTYDEKQRIIKAVRKEPDDTNTFIFDFDDEGRLFHYSVTNNRGEIINETTRQYENGEIAFSETTLFFSNLNKKDIIKTTYHIQ
ncbi:MAG: hypothetical protein PHR20_08935 [Bacteroidales bacterium]|nr:hypothetical protein [Bacteroidales bacterium]